MISLSTLSHACLIQMSCQGAFEFDQLLRNTFPFDTPLMRSVQLDQVYIVLLDIAVLICSHGHMESNRLEPVRWNTSVECERESVPYQLVQLGGVLAGHPDLVPCERMYLAKSQGAHQKNTRSHPMTVHFPL